MCMSERGYELARLMYEREWDQEYEQMQGPGTSASLEISDAKLARIQSWIEDKRTEPPTGRVDATFTVVASLLAEVERQRLVIERYSEQRQALRNAISGVLTETESLEGLRRVWDRTKVPPR